MELAHLDRPLRKLIVLVEDHQEDLPVRAAEVATLAQTVVAFEKIAADEVSVHLLDEESMKKLHQQFFGDSSLTDCLSFPIDEEDVPYRLLGDVMVCPQAAILYTREHGGDPYEELSLYIVHGLLHLCGYDDQSEEECKEMREGEARHLANLRQTGGILSPC